MEENKIILIEKYLGGLLTPHDESILNEYLIADKNFKQEFDEQVKIKGILQKMMIKNPSKEVWDNYWVSIYNKTERSIAWIFLLAGITIVLGYAAYEIINVLLTDSSIPLLLKFGISFAIIGCIFLLYSVLKEKVKIRKSDKYKEIQR